MAWWLLLALLVLLVVIASRFAFARADCGPWARAHGPGPFGPRDPREELRVRLARGDLTPEEYERRKALL